MSIPRLLALLAVAAVVVWGAVSWLSAPTDEERVREQIVAVIEGARAADLGAALAPLSADYTDDQGMTRDAIRGLLFREFRARGAISVLRGPIAVHIDGGRATASFDALLAERAAGSPVPLDGDALHFDVTLDNASGDWLITGHTRAPLEDGWRLEAPPE